MSLISTILLTCKIWQRNTQEKTKDSIFSNISLFRWALQRPWQKTIVGRLFRNTNECFKHYSVLQQKIKNYLTSYMAGIWFVDNKINSSEYLYKAAEMFESGGNDFQSCFVQIFTKHSIEPLTEYKFLHTPIFWKFFFLEQKRGPTFWPFLI